MLRMPVRRTRCLVFRRDGSRSAGRIEAAGETRHRRQAAQHPTGESRDDSGRPRVAGAVVLDLANRNASTADARPALQRRRGRRAGDRPLHQAPVPRARHGRRGGGRTLVHGGDRTVGAAGRGGRLERRHPGSRRRPAPERRHRDPRACGRGNHPCCASRQRRCLTTTRRQRVGDGRARRARARLLAARPRTGAPTGPYARPRLDRRRRIRRRGRAAVRGALAICRGRDRSGRSGRYRWPRETAARDRRGRRALALPCARRDRVSSRRGAVRTRAGAPITRDTARRSRNPVRGRRAGAAHRPRRRGGDAHDSRPARPWHSGGRYGGAARSRAVHAPRARHRVTHRLARRERRKRLSDARQRVSRRPRRKRLGVPAHAHRRRRAVRARRARSPRPGAAARAAAEAGFPCTADAAPRLAIRRAPRLARVARRRIPDRRLAATSAVLGDRHQPAVRRARPARHCAGTRLARRAQADRTSARDDARGAARRLHGRTDGAHRRRRGRRARPAVGAALPAPVALRLDMAARSHPILGARRDLPHGACSARWWASSYWRTRSAWARRKPTLFVLGLVTVGYVPVTTALVWLTWGAVAGQLATLAAGRYVPYPKAPSLPLAGPARIVVGRALRYGRRR